jgi:hypothetical protein
MLWRAGLSWAGKLHPRLRQELYWVISQSRSSGLLQFDVGCRASLAEKVGTAAGMKRTLWVIIRICLGDEQSSMV